MIETENAKLQNSNKTTTKQKRTEAGALNTTKTVTHNTANHGHPCKAHAKT